MRKATGNRRVIRAISLGLAATPAATRPVDQASRSRRRRKRSTMATAHRP